MAKLAGTGQAAAILLPAALVVMAFVVLRPEFLLLAIFSALVLLELGKSGPGTLESLSSVYYRSVGKGLTVMNLFFIALVLAVAFNLYRRRRPLLFAGPLTVALILLAAATITGAVTSHFAGISSKDIFVPVVTMVPLILLPVLVVNIAQERDLLKIMLPLIGVLTGIKALVGLWLALSGHGSLVDGHSATYLEPSANWLNLLVLLVLIAAALRRVRLPLWAWALAPLAVAELAFSYRRGFWLGVLSGAVLVVLLASSSHGRRVVIPTVVLIATLGWLGLMSLGSGAAGSDPVVKRLESLQPGKLELNVQDRYRLDERRNVLANLEEHPIAGLGIAVPWVAPHPLSVQHPGDRTYTHMIVLWYWLNLGLLGLIAYVALMASAIGTAFLVWRRHASELVRCAALGLMATLVGSIAVETTGSFMGVDVRFTIVMGVILGLLATAYFETLGSLRPRTSARSSPTLSARSAISRAG
jgi:O-Antigen ligase